MASKKCKECKNIFDIVPYGNNKQYCNAICRDVAYKRDNAQKIKETTKRNNEKRQQRITAGRQLIPCLICGKGYQAPIMHAWQVHGVSRREYKQMYGLDIQKGIIIEPLREKRKNDALENNMQVLLPKWGEKTRLKMGHNMRYKRSKQTMRRLKKQFSKK